jgi:hypothetical protein
MGADDIIRNECNSPQHTERLIHNKVTDSLSG